ncbi:MAG: hypothetical protein S4CHLAM20_12470 [Chlamydiia bacterium]|nr:hypothetical protein [Chlamydiia bacterium]
MLEASFGPTNYNSFGDIERPTRLKKMQEDFKNNKPTSTIVNNPELNQKVDTFCRDQIQDANQSMKTKKCLTISGLSATVLVGTGLCLSLPQLLAVKAALSVVYFAGTTAGSIFLGKMAIDRFTKVRDLQIDAINDAKDIIQYQATGINPQVVYTSESQDF